MCGNFTYSGSLWMRTHGTGCLRVQYPLSFWISGFPAATTVWQPMHVLIAGIPGSGDLFAAKWQYRQFMFSVSTCTGCGNRTGCTGLFPALDDAPLYADTRAARAASAKNAGTAAHCRRSFIYGREESRRAL